MRITFILYLVISSYLDLKKRKIPVLLYLLFAVTGILENLLWREIRWMDMLTAMIPGLLLLLLSRYSRGAVGAGDGWFFIVASVYLHFWYVLALLFYGLILCSMFCLGLVFWGSIRGINVRRIRLPFLMFLLPAWIWIEMLG